ncbi:MAG: EAL domain-containing protein [Kofleriaceae bacterium]|nr:EAL domain-containing protein [Kofleriaceae bacterium]
MTLDLTEEDRSALRTFWHFYAPRSLAIDEALRRVLSRSRVWSRTVNPDTIDDIARQQRESVALQGAAIIEDRWEPYLARLRAEGEHYALAGLSYSAWFELLGDLRDITRDHLAEFLRESASDRQALVFEIARGLSLFIDIIAGQVGEAYLQTKQRIVVETEERYRAMFEASPQPMWTFDRETLRFCAVNDAAIAHYGYSRDEFLAMTIMDIRPPEDVPAVSKVVGRELRGLTSRELWKHRKKDGSTILVEIRGNELVLGDRALRLIQVTDVTERIRAEEALRTTEEQLRHAQKMEAIGRLAGGVAHDFNNVLTVVQSYAAMLEETIDVADSRHEDAAEIRRTAERATAITRQLLAVSRHSIVEPKLVAVDDLIAGFVPILRRLVGTSVGLVVQRGDVPSVMIDPGQLEQVLMNLALNARDAMPAGGRITIETRTVELDDETASVHAVTAGRYVEIAVTDTGTGIDAETQARIFEPFFTTKEPGRGTGLGLSIVHGIITQAGGRISLYTELGRGSTFRIQLPVRDESPESVARAPVEAPRTLPPVRILVVDDQPSVRGVTARILKDAGCHVIEASSAAEARRLCVQQEEPIDLTLLDVVLPDADGNELVHQLRELRPAMKFVQMSGYPVGIPSAGDLLAKPFSPSELRAAIARVVGEGVAPTIEAAVEPKQRRTVLVVDDDLEFRKSVVRILRRGGYAVSEVESGFQAISALEKTPFDVVVSDVEMPDGGGLDLLRSIRRIDLDVPVILMTGAPSLDAAAQAVEYGAFRYLTKPFDSSGFLKMIEHAARAHALARLRRAAFNVGGAHGGVADRAGLEVRFEQAIAGMWMAFQPIVHAGSGALYGVEALVRTSEPSMPNPGAFLDAATHLDRLPLLGRRVRALSAAALAGRADDASLFVNLHPEDLHDAELVSEDAPLTRIASRVVLEITERASLETSAAVSERIARLRALGYRLAVDDIGAGYSGLTSFTELMPEVVKIDMSLIRDVHQSTLKQRTIAALCQLCHEVGSLVVAEGVETNDERDCLVSLGCDLLQGYLIARPARELPR